MKNIVRKLTNISLIFHEPLDKVVATYNKFYSECSPNEIDHPVTMIYDEEILKMTKKYYQLRKK